MNCVNNQIKINNFYGLTEQKLDWYKLLFFTTANTCSEASD
jgi:hypothetical protein